MKKKSVVLALAGTMLFGVAAGGTLAWLTANTQQVTNTFTVGNINIDLYEHKRNADGTLTGTEIKGLNDYIVLPGTSELKDPTVEVQKNSEDCYVFLQVKEVNNTVKDNEDAFQYVTFTIDTAVWKPLKNANDDHVEVNGCPVYYANYTTKDEDQTYNVLAGTKVSYDEDLTKNDIDELGAQKPQLIFKAFAVQVEADGRTAENPNAGSAFTAWGKVTESEKLTK